MAFERWIVHRRRVQWAQRIPTGLWSYRDENNQRVVVNIGSVSEHLHREGALEALVENMRKELEGTKW
jgi:hypothetical protein